MAIEKLPETIEGWEALRDEWERSHGSPLPEGWSLIMLCGRINQLIERVNNLAGYPARPE